MKIWVLLDAVGEAVLPGTPLLTFRGEPVVLEGGRPPQHDGSTGRVWVKTDSGRTDEFFPSVVGLKWELV
jgi:hypothetical protein